VSSPVSLTAYCSLEERVDGIFNEISHLYFRIRRLCELRRNFNAHLDSDRYCTVQYSIESACHLTMSGGANHHFRHPLKAAYPPDGRASLRRCPINGASIPCFCSAIPFFDSQRFPATAIYLPALPPMSLPPGIRSTDHLAFTIISTAGYGRVYLLSVFRNCHADSVPYIYLTPGNQPCLCQHEHLFPLALSSAGVFYNGRWLAALQSCPCRL
jgi:hypothetical protein